MGVRPFFDSDFLRNERFFQLPGNRGLHAVQFFENSLAPHRLPIPGILLMSPTAPQTRSRPDPLRDLVELAVRTIPPNTQWVKKLLLPHGLNARRFQRNQPTPRPRMPAPQSRRHSNTRLISKSCRSDGQCGLSSVRNRIQSFRSLEVAVRIVMFMAKSA